MEDVIQHYGVVGMKWGRRKSGTSANRHEKFMRNFAKDVGKYESLYKKGKVSDSTMRLVRKTQERLLDAIERPGGRVLTKRGQRKMNRLDSKHRKDLFKINSRYQDKVAKVEVDKRRMNRLSDSTNKRLDTIRGDLYKDRAVLTKRTRRKK